MTISSALLGLALLGLVGLYIARPVIRGRKTHLHHLTTREALLAQKDLVLDQMQILDFDYNTGKIPEDVYREQRALYKAEAVELLKQLDALDGTIPATGMESMAEEVEIAPDTDADMEAAILALRQRELASEQPRDEEVGLEAPSQEVYEPIGTTNGSSKFCPQCGQQTDPNDKFCAHCGHQLRLTQVV